MLHAFHPAASSVLQDQGTTQPDRGRLQQTPVTQTRPPTAVLAESRTSEDAQCHDNQPHPDFEGQFL